jgi:hypothetical protein
VGSQQMLNDTIKMATKVTSKDADKDSNTGRKLAVVLLGGGPSTLLY